MAQVWDGPVGSAESSQAVSLNKISIFLESFFLLLFLTILNVCIVI
jgi:hypothetical protein